MEKPGKIEACQGHIPECHHKCCVFGANYIVLLPGELEKARATGQVTDHLTVIDDNYFHGQKVQCNRHCDQPGDMKPCDCAWYPYWPSLDSESKLHLIRGTKCPLTEDELANHKKQVLEEAQALIDENPEAMIPFFQGVKMVGYEPVAD